uniref:Uncharacterized protein n=1 Tax=Arundo donax TaxID=35708 RepID=A0A0A9ERU5_ARUDO
MDAAHISGLTPMEIETPKEPWPYLRPHVDHRMVPPRLGPAHAAVEKGWAASPSPPWQLGATSTRCTPIYASDRRASRTTTVVASHGYR